RLDPRGLVGSGNGLLRRNLLALRAFDWPRLELARQRQHLGYLDNLDRLRRISLRKSLLKAQLVVRRLEIQFRGAAPNCERQREDAHRRAALHGKGYHFASPIRSRDQLRE